MYNFTMQNRHILADCKFFVTNFDMLRRDSVGRYEELQQLRQPNETNRIFKRGNAL
ncbi:hypothetical protein Musp01_20480 [Muricauda sp. NBRC 101325]|nr:hypothetical protein Musp01_20480 [Muricauda sp. NBRC 101325]